MHDGKNHDQFISVNLVYNRVGESGKHNTFCLMQIRMPCFGECYQSLHNILKILNKIPGKRLIKVFVIINDIVKFGLGRIVKFKCQIAH
jgi:hypothetical protein